MVRTKQTPSLNVTKAVAYIQEIETQYRRLFMQKIEQDPQFVATRTNKRKLLVELNNEWLPRICRENNIGLYTLSSLDSEELKQLLLKRVIA